MCEFRLTYTVSQDRDSKLWYAHMVGYPNIPVMLDERHTFCKTKKEALGNAAIKCGLSYTEYMDFRKKHGVPTSLHSKN